VWYSATVAFESAATALTLGDCTLARKLIDAFHHLPDADEPRGTVNGLLLQAWLAEVEGSVDEAREHLAAAMVAAHPDSLVESFVRAGPAIVRMASEDTDGPSSLRARILSRAREVALPTPGADLVDPLTDRELEILSYLPSRFTNTELADHFYVSVNTIKTHMAHIYRKLDVANRNGAIARARELGILRGSP
jgi:LuxR family maltose regulon positive regulatory protein